MGWLVLFLCAVAGVVAPELVWAAESRRVTREREWLLRRERAARGRRYLTLLLAIGVPVVMAMMIGPVGPEPPAILPVDLWFCLAVLALMALLWAGALGVFEALSFGVLRIQGDTLSFDDLRVRRRDISRIERIDSRHVVLLLRPTGDSPRELHVFAVRGNGRDLDEVLPELDRWWRLRGLDFLKAL